MSLYSFISWLIDNGIPFLHMRRPDTGMRNKVLIALTVWIAAAVVIGASGFTAKLTPPVPQVILLGLVLLLFIFLAITPGFRRWIMSVDPRALLLIHMSRFVGIYFLMLYAEGRLPYDFAVPGGWGDIIVASGAVALAAFCPIEGRRGKIFYFIWNTAGLVDILFVVATAASLAMANPESMSDLLKLPLWLLPSFLVPVIIFTHLIIFVRLYRGRYDHLIRF